jgi:hypothetical protein
MRTWGKTPEQLAAEKVSEEALVDSPEESQESEPEPSVVNE